LQRSDNSQHLLSDPYHNYGSINASGSHVAPPDPEEIRRQRDALERICAQTSEFVLSPPTPFVCALANLSNPYYSKLIDVSQSAYTEEGSKLTSEYPRLFNERFPPTKPVGSRPESADGSEVDEDEATWLAKIVGETNEEEGSWERVVPLKSGTLTVQFDDPPVSDNRRSGR